MEKEIAIYEYDWWKVFVGYILLLFASIPLFGAWYHLLDSSHIRIPLFFDAIISLRLFGPALFCLLYSVQGLIKIRTIPKLIIFKQNSIQVFYPSGGNEAFLYEDLRRFVIYKKSNWNKGQEWVFSRASLFFASKSSKISFNPGRVFNFTAVLETIRTKGLGHVVEQNN